MRDAIPVRKQFTPTQRAKTLADYHASGLTQSVFAEQAGISVGSLCNWLRQERERLSGQSEVSFLEMPTFRPGSAPVYKVHFPDGVAVEVPRGFAAAEVKEILRLVREL